VTFPSFPPFLPSGGFLQSGARLQERQRRLAEGAGALLDVVPQSPAQLLGAGRLLLLLRRPAVADQRAADQPPAGRARRLHHAGQQVGDLGFLFLYVFYRHWKNMETINPAGVYQCWGNRSCCQGTFGFSIMASSFRI